jgi:single-stranded-DNA-specific exonuclease
MSVNLRNSFLELTALATISDMVPQIEDNKMFIEEGLRSLKNTFRPGLGVFLEILGQGEVVAGGYYKIIQALNAAESIDFKNQAYDLLIEPSEKKCMELAQDLLAKVAYKQMKIDQITKEVERRIAKKSNEPIIFEGDPAWRLVLAGPVASIIYMAHKKPTFIFKYGDSESSGSVRSTKELNSVEAMKTCKDLLITYGGHPQASGFRIKNENLEKFKEGLVKHFSKQ